MRIVSRSYLCLKKGSQIPMTEDKSCMAQRFASFWTQKNQKNYEVRQLVLLYRLCTSLSADAKVHVGIYFKLSLQSYAISHLQIPLI